MPSGGCSVYLNYRGVVKNYQRPLKRPEIPIDTHQISLIIVIRNAKKHAIFLELQERQRLGENDCCGQDKSMLDGSSIANLNCAQDILTASW